MSHAAAINKPDLLYYMHDSCVAFRFCLSGCLSGAGLQDLKQAWRTAFSVMRGRRLVVDLTLVRGMDRQGRELLEEWHEDGAWLVATSFDAKERIEAMISRPVTFLGKAWRPANRSIA